MLARPTLKTSYALMLVALAGNAVAQQAAAPTPVDATLESITVTGIRRAIESAITTKRESNSIVESVNAEDMGKLPDVSIAESISRLPGVAAQRTGGRAQQISIRGLSNDFSTTLLNGREQVSTGDSRGVEYDQYPSELFSSVVIYKTPDAGLVGQGLSGTVDVRTLRPLDLSKRTIAANYRKVKSNFNNALGEGDGKRFSLSYVDQFADRKLGVLLGFARLEDTGATGSRFESWGSTNVGGATGPLAPNGFNAWTDRKGTERDAAVLTLQARPSTAWSSTLDVYWSKFKDTKTTKGFQAPIPGAAGGYDIDGVLSNATIVNGVVQSGTFSNFKGVVRNDAEDTKDRLNSYGWNNQFKLANDWTAGVDLSTSQVKRTGTIVETTAGLPVTRTGTTTTGQFDTISFTGYDGNNTGAAIFRTGLSYADPNLIKLTDVQGWGGGPASPQAGYVKQPNVKDKINALRLNGIKDLGDSGAFSKLDVGVNYTQRKKTREYVEGRLVIANSTDPNATANVPGAGVSTIPVAAGSIDVVSFDPVAALSSIYVRAPKTGPDILNKDWQVQEKVATVYGKLDIDTTINRIAVRGNVGAQIVRTKQDSTAYSVDRANSECANYTANCVPGSASAGTSYTDILPSLNLVGDLGDGHIVRFGLARQMARPNMNDMRASIGFGVDAQKGILTGDGGNPQLKPFRANAIDLSYEKYFGNKAYVGVAGFYKNLTTYIVKAGRAYDFSPYITSTTALPVTGAVVGEFTQPVNGGGGDLHGVELSASFPFGMLSPALDGFGVQGNYAATNSSVRLPTSGLQTNNVNTSSVPLPGLSRTVSSITFYYEKYGFQARVSQKSRSSFLGEVSNFTGDRELTYIKGESITDAQIGYEFQDGPLKGLSILLQGYNLGNARYIRYKDSTNNEVENTRYGRTYQLGIAYKL